LTIEGKHLEKRGAVFTECTDEEVEYFKLYTGEEEEEEEGYVDEENEGGDMKDDEIKVCGCQMKRINQ
jgi:hypothetical protein